MWPRLAPPTQRYYRLRTDEGPGTAKPQGREIDGRDAAGESGAEDADRREARRGRQRGDLPEREPGHRGGARRGRRRVIRGHAPRHRARHAGPSTRPTGRPTGPSAGAASSSSMPALAAEREELREQLILEVGCPRMLTFGPQLDAPLDGAITYPAQLIDEYAWETDLPVAADFRGNDNFRRISEGAGRRGRGHRPVELPVRGLDHEAGAGPRHREHGRAEAGTRHAVERHLRRPHRRRADRHPGRRPERRAVVRPSRRRGAHALAGGGPHLLHRLDGGRTADHGEGRRPRSSGCSWSWAASRRTSSSTTPTSPPPCCRAWRRARMPGRAARSRPGCCCPAPATTRASSS